MSESITERLRRLRPLVPNAVKDKILMLRIRQGWDDQRIVMSDLVAMPVAASLAQPLRRSRRAR